MKKSNILRFSNKNLFSIEKISFAISLAMVGFLSSKTVVLGSFPLGISLVAASSKSLNMILAICGSIFGYFGAKSTGISIRYISTLIAICAIKWSFNDFKKYNNALYVTLITFVPTFVTGIAFRLAYGLTLHSFVECVLESVISSGVSYVLQLGFKSVRFYKNRIETGYILPMFFAFLLLFPLSNLKILSINLLNSFMIFMVLVMSENLKSFGGNLSGLLHGFFQMISYPNNYAKIISSIFSGVSSGLFSKLGKIYIILSYVFTNLVIHFQLNSKIFASEILEQLIGVVLFLVFSKKIKITENKLESKSEGLKSLVSQNFSILGNLFSEIQKKFEKNSENLDKKYTNDSKVIVNYYLGGISKICKQFVDSLEHESDINENMSFKIKKMIQKVFNVNSKVILRYNDLSKIIIQIEFLKCDIPENMECLEEEIGFICGKSFMRPEIFQNGQSVIIKFCEKTKFRPQVRIKQHISKGEICCGDSYKTFFDGIGNYYVVISDGMGKGNLASISGNIATKTIHSMLRSELDVESAIKMTNSILMENSSDESLASLDILKINLFSGKSYFVKLGAASSFIKHGSKITKIASKNPPIGILPEVNFFKIHFDISNQDSILMVSDGISDTGEEWIETLFRNEINDIDIVDKVMKISNEKRVNSSDDDMTAIMVKLLD